MPTSFAFYQALRPHISKVTAVTCAAPTKTRGSYRLVLSGIPSELHMPLGQAIQAQLNPGGMNRVPIAYGRGTANPSRFSLLLYSPSHLHALLDALEHHVSLKPQIEKIRQRLPRR